jgi:hypothetical protein
MDVAGQVVAECLDDPAEAFLGLPEQLQPQRGLPLPGHVLCHGQQHGLAELVDIRLRLGA